MPLPIAGAIVGLLKKRGLQAVAEVALSKGQDYVEKKLGVKLSENMSEEDFIELRKRAMEHEEFKLLQEVEDRKSAREREVELATNNQVPLINKIISPTLALFVTILTFCLFGVIIFVEVDTLSKDILIYILGVLSAALTQILSYYFGSSSQNQEHENTIRDIFRDR